MGDTAHSVTSEGAQVGVVGAAIVAVWYFIFDVIAGHPLHTPDLIGELLGFGRHATDAGLVGTLAVVTVVHTAVFVVAGIGLAALAHLALRDVAWRMGVWIGFVIALFFFTSLAYALGPITGEQLPYWKMVGGSLLGVIGMGSVLWRLHPALGRSFHEVPLGDEGESVPHPPGR